MRNMEETLECCIQPLRRDPEIALDVRRELAGHLEEHLAGGMSEEEALRRFGDPEEIGEELFQANFRRMNLRAKIRLAVMILAIPAVIAAFFFSINFRFWIGLAAMKDFFDTPPGPLKTVSAIVSATGLGKTRLSPEDALIACGDSSRGATANLSAAANAQYAIAERHPDNRVFRANAVLHMLNGASAEKSPFLIAEIEKAGQLEPENGLYDFLLAALLLEDALDLSTAPPEARFQVRDRARLDQAMAIFRTGLSKPFVHTYLREMAAKRDALLNSGTMDFASGVQRIARQCRISLSHLNFYRTLGRALPFYGELLTAEGRQSEGDFFLNAWKPFLRHIVRDETTLIGILVEGSILENQLRICRFPIPDIRKQELEQTLAPIEKLRSGIRNAERGEMLRACGLLSSMLLPGAAWKPAHPALEEALEPERRLNYVFADGILLQLFNLLGGFALSGYAAAMFVSLLRGRTGFLLTFSRRDVFRIAVWGIFIPLLLFFALMEFSPLGGRSLGLNRHNPAAFLRLAIEAFLFLFLLPAPFLILWHRACRKRGRELGFRKLPSAVVHCNMFLGWVVLLVSFTGLIRPGLCLAERYWTNREQLLIHTEFSSGLEDQAVRDTRMELLKILPK